MEPTIPAGEDTSAPESGRADSAPLIDPGQATLDALRTFEPKGRKARREFLATLAGAVGAMPFLAPERLEGQEVAGRTSRTRMPPRHSPRVMEPVNIHEIRDVAKANLNEETYAYIESGAEDELTLTHNLEAFRRTLLTPRFMRDVSDIDTSLELLGQQLDFPILMCPATKNRVYPEGDRAAAVGAAAAGAVYACPTPALWMDELEQAGQAPVLWGGTLGHGSQDAARAWARNQESLGASALSITVDHRYTPNRDRSIRAGVAGYEAANVRPVTPDLTWDYLNWLRSGSSLPIVVKGILTEEDAEAAVENGADAIVVSNHGGREIDGAVPTIVALPEVVDAVGGRIPVLVDGGIRRGSDALKALALGATAVMIGRPMVWGLAAFGPVGVTRVVELLHHELMVSMGLAGVPDLASISRELVQLPWER